MENEFNNIISDMIFYIFIYFIYWRILYSYWMIKTFKLWIENIRRKKIHERLLNGTYDILTINDKESLIKPVNGNTILYYVTIDELFNILYSTLSTIGHGERCRMDSELKLKITISRTELL